MLITYGDKAPHHLCACVHVCVSVNMEYTTYRIHLPFPKANNLQRKSTTPFVCMCVCVCVCVCVYMHVSVSVNMESTTYRIHLALPNANNLQRLRNTPFVCVCARVCVGVHACVCFRQHGVYHLSYPPSLTNC